MTARPEPDHGSTTTQLKALAPAAAEWPRWWRRNLTPGALYAIGAVVLTAVVTVTVAVVTSHVQSAKLDAISQQLGQLQLTVGILEHDVDQLNRWKDRKQELAEQLENPYVKSHPHLGERKPTP